MNAILALALVSVAALALGMGYLNTDIMLEVQNFGVGDKTFEAPITDANIDMSIVHFTGVNSSGDPVAKNEIKSCSFHFPENQEFPGLNDISTKVICKLVDENGDVVAEGSIMGPFIPSTNYIIQITDLAFENSNFVIHVANIIIVILGEELT